MDFSDNCFFFSMSYQQSTPNIVNFIRHREQHAEKLFGILKTESKYGNKQEIYDYKYI